MRSRIGRSTSQNRISRSTSVRVLGVVDEGFVEDHALAVAPAVGLAVDLDVAAVVIGRDQPEVVAQRAGVGVAVRVSSAAGRQRGEHRGADVRDLAQQLRRARTQALGRRVGVAVPLQVEALPARVEERVEAGVVVAGGHADAPGLVQAPAPRPGSPASGPAAGARSGKAANGRVRAAPSRARTAPSTCCRAPAAPCSRSAPSSGRSARARAGARKAPIP